MQYNIFLTRYKLNYFSTLSILNNKATFFLSNLPEYSFIKIYIIYLKYYIIYFNK